MGYHHIFVKHITVLKSFINIIFKNLVLGSSSFIGEKHLHFLALAVKTVTILPLTLSPHQQFLVSVVSILTITSFLFQFSATYLLKIPDSSLGERY